MNQLNVSVIASLFANLVGRTVLAEGKDGNADTRYKIASLSTDKTGTMKDGTKGEYVVLQREDDTAVVMNLHPNAAKKLFTKGEDSGLKLLDEQVAETAVTSEQAAPVADLPTEVAVEGNSAEPAAEQAAPVDTQEAAAELTTDEQEAVASELAAEQAGETTVAESTEVKVEETAPSAPTSEGAAPEVKADNSAEPAAEVPAEPTKKDRAIVIVKAGLAAGKARKDIIAQLRTDLEMGVPGASTYFQNVKSGKWA